MVDHPTLLPPRPPLSGTLSALSLHAFLLLITQQPKDQEAAPATITLYRQPSSRQFYYFHPSIQLCRRIGSISSRRSETVVVVAAAASCCEFRLFPTGQPRSVALTGSGNPVCNNCDKCILAEVASNLISSTYQETSVSVHSRYYRRLYNFFRRNFSVCVCVPEMVC